MARIFKTPFGAQGDTEQVPEAPQGDGSVSLTQGFGYDYEREYEDPAAKDIRREVMNGLFHDITEAIGDIQLSGVAKWSADAAPYPAGAVVWHDSVAWMSTAGNNSSVPGAGSWKVIDLSSSIRLSEPIDQVPDAETVQEALASFGAFAGDGYQNIAVFDTAGAHEWAVPDVLREGLRKAHVTVIGGGGGGGTGTQGDPPSGGGGGGGGVAHKLADLTGLATVAISVGSGGAGGSSAGGGESSSFGSFCSATGGAGAVNSGGGGGMGVGGDVNSSLGPGASRAEGSSTSESSSSSGSGGGPGGAGSHSFSGAGSDAPGPGGGGSGSTGGQAPGDGASGIVIVRW